MISSANMASSVSFASDCFSVTLADGQEIRIELSAFPRLWHATPEERACYEIVANGEIIVWPNLNEDIFVEDLLDGRQKSYEGRKSVKRWLDSLREFRKSPASDTETFTEWDLKRQGLWRR